MNNNNTIKKTKIKQQNKNKKTITKKNKREKFEIIQLEIDRNSTPWNLNRYSSSSSESNNDFFFKFPKPDAIKEFLDKYIVGQNTAKRDLASLTHFHYTTYNFASSQFQSKKIPLLIGPTGSGKTLMLRYISEFLNLPYVKVDATTFTPTGYYGGNFSDCFSDLIRNANYNLEKAERGIIFIDEVDKIIISNNRNRFDKLSSGHRTMFELLKILETGTIDIVVRPKGMQYSPFAKSKVFKLKKDGIFFIFSGAFNGIETIHNEGKFNDSSFNILRNKEPENSYMNFRKDRMKNDNTNEIEYSFKDVVQFGMPKEFVGRISSIITFNKLTVPNLIHMLHSTERPLLDRYIRYFARNNIELKFSEEATHKIAFWAHKEDFGGRGLHHILDRYILDLIYFVSVNPKKIKSIYIDKTGLLDLKNIVFTYEKI